MLCGTTHTLIQIIQFKSKINCVLLSIVLIKYKYLNFAEGSRILTILTYSYTIKINIRRVAETQMVSVRKRNIQGRYNSIRHLQRRYLELPPLRVVSIVDSIVTSSVPISLENTKTTRTRLRLYI